MTTILQESTFQSNCDNTGISVLRCYQEGNIRGVVQMVHGMAEHKERYIDIMRYLAEKGYVCVMHDHRGHGKSVAQADDLGYINGSNAEYMIADMHQLNMALHQEFPHQPIYLFGHSMGSLAVRAYLKRYDTTISGLIVCGSPSKNAGAGIGKLVARAMTLFKGDHYRSPMIQNLAFGKHSDGFSESISENVWICSDMDVVRAYDQDPLCGFTFTLNGFANLFALMQDVYHPHHWHVRQKQLPIRFIAGREDPCIISSEKFQEAAGFLRQVGYEQVSARLFDGMRHEILNEKDRQLVYEDIALFLEKCKETRN